MSLAALIPSEAILDGLESTSKESVLKEMVEALAAAGRVGPGAVDPMVEALLEREALGSTGIGRGIAVPHAKHESVRGLVAALGRSDKGIEFSALDGQPVYLVFLLLASKGSSGPHLEALARAAKLARDEHFHRFLRNARNSGELEAVLREADIKYDARVRGATAPQQGNVR